MVRNGTTLTLERKAGGRARKSPAAVRSLVIAGWTGRNAEAMEAHIRELEALGIARPKSTPIFYRVAASLLTTAPEIEVAGDSSSGEAEAVVFALDDGLWVGVGSDHTDRKVETVGVTISKQMCAKPVAGTVWRFDDVADHWDRLVLRSHAIEGKKRRLYQEGPVARIRPPRELVGLYLGEGKRLKKGTAMFCGTLAVIGRIAPADAFEIELEDPVLRRRIRHRYRIRRLPVEG
jgi:hypothetical protein